MVRLYVAEDHEIVRHGIKQIIGIDPTLELVGEAGNGVALLAGLRTVTVDVLLMDMNMPGIAGSELIGRVRAQCPDIRILVLSMHNEPEIVMRALRSGAAGYLTKDSDPRKIVEAIHAVHAGSQYIASNLAQQIVLSHVQHDGAKPHSKLSSREMEIFRLLVKGLTVGAIAEQLNISTKTVSTHKIRLLEKLDLATLADLLKYAMANGLFQEPVQ